MIRVKARIFRKAHSLRKGKGILMDKRLADLALEVEAALTLEGDLADQAIAALNTAAAGAVIERSDLDSTDKVLSLIYAIRPGWSVSMRGTAHLPNGHWRCTLRRSDRRDNDEYLGVGRGPTLPHSLLAALLKALASAV